MPSLREIEQAVATLWLNREAREWLLSGGKGERPACLADAPPEVLDQVERKGIDLYGGLITFGHHDVMESIYPYCSKLLGEKWEAVVEDYLLRFPPEHYNLNRLCNRLSEYFTKYGGKLLERYPFLPELADYEWIELEKQEEDKQIETAPHKELTDLAQIAAFSPLVNPTLTIRHYNYDVLTIGSKLEDGKKLPKIKPEPTIVAVYRHPESHRCKFVELGSTAARIVELSREGVTYQQLVPMAVALNPHVAPQEAVTDFLELVEDLQEMGIFVGSVAGS